MSHIHPDFVSRRIETVPRGCVEAAQLNCTASELAREGRYLEARARFEQAVHLWPGCAEAWQNLGHLEFIDRHIEQAASCYTRALELGVDPSPASGQRWMAWMLLGRFEEAWKESDMLRRVTPAEELARMRWRGDIQWDGTPLARRKVLVRCRHGLGDTILFSRYFRKLRQTCTRLGVYAQPELLPLLRLMPEIDTLASVFEPPSSMEADVELEVMELAYAFRTTLPDVPAWERYLTVPRSLVRRLARLIASRREVHVGVVWNTGDWGNHRSVKLEVLAPLANVPGVRLYSLQRGPAARQLRDFPGPIVDCSRLFDGMLETAAMIASLDLVICVDTMIAHLAGALGRPVWVLLLHWADWRWMLERNDSPWYPSMRLFRQPVPGDWDTPMQAVVRGLRALVEEKLTPRPGAPRYLDRRTRYSPDDTRRAA